MFGFNVFSTLLNNQVHYFINEDNFQTEIGIQKFYEEMLLSL